MVVVTVVSVVVVVVVLPVPPLSNPSRNCPLFLLPRILSLSHQPVSHKVQIFLHVTIYIIHTKLMRLNTNKNLLLIIDFKKK